MTTEIPALKLNDKTMQDEVNAAPTLYEKIDAAAGKLWQVDAKAHECTGALESALSEDFASIEAYLVELENMQEPRFLDAVIQSVTDNFGEYVTSECMPEIRIFVAKVTEHEL